MPRAKDLGIANHSERAGREQAAQIAIALLADTAKLVLASARWSQRWSRALPIPREPQIAPTSLALSCPLRSRPRHQQRTN